MSLEVIIGLVGGALVALFGGIGWARIQKHGQSIERAIQAEEERDAANQQADEAARAPLDGPQSVDVLRRVRDED